MAEGLFRLHTNHSKKWDSRSAGIAANNGCPASLEAKTVSNEVGVDLTNHRSQIVTEEIANQSDLILVMKERHRDSIRIKFPSVAHRVYLINELGTKRVNEIEDPYGGSVEIYKKTRDSINQAILELIRFLELGDN